MQPAAAADGDRALLIFMVGPYTPIGELMGHLPVRDEHLLALVIAECTSRRRTTCRRAGGFGGSIRGWSSRPGCWATGGAGVPPSYPLAAPAWPWPSPSPGRGRREPSVRHHHRLPSVRDTTPDLYDVPTTGLPSALPFALVLLVVALPLPLAAYIWSSAGTDVEVDRRDFPVRAALSVAAGNGWPCSGPPAPARPRCWRPSPGWAPDARPGACTPGSHLDHAARGGAAVAGPGRPAAPDPACSRTCRCAATSATRRPRTAARAR